MNVYAPPTSVENAKPQRELRKQPRYKLPARLVVQGASIAVVDWSRGGLGFSIKGAEIGPGDTLNAELTFDLPGGALSMSIAGVIRHYDKRSGRGGLSFDPPDGGASAIDRVIEDYLAGKIQVKNGMLAKGETARTVTLANLGPAAVSGNGAGVIFRRAIGLLLFTLAGAIALYFLGTSIYDRLFVFEAVSSQVAFDTLEQDAPVAGTLTAVAEAGPIANGAILFSVVDANGAVTEVASPCTCEVAPGSREFGAFVSAGSTIVKLVRTDSPARVLVSVSFPDVRRIYEGAAVDLRFLDGQSVKGAHIAAIRSLGGQQNGLVTIEVDPGRPLTAAQFGEPVYARFDTAPWRLEGRFSAQARE